MIGFRTIGLLKAEKWQPVVTSVPHLKSDNAYGRRPTAHRTWGLSEERESS